MKLVTTLTEGIMETTFVIKHNLDTIPNYELTEIESGEEVPATVNFLDTNTLEIRMTGDIKCNLYKVKIL